VDVSLTGTIFDIIRYAVHDGPGIRSTVFFKGCPLHCLWCANPESQAFSPELTHNKTECLGCGICRQGCPKEAITLIREEPVIDPVKCDLCGLCAENCPSEALRIMGRTVTMDGLYKEMASDRPFWDRSGGGVTLSGGEPLAQFDFVLAFLKLCKDRHVSTAIETCLYTDQEKIEAVLPFLDHVICDLKIMDSESHKTWTGVLNGRIKDNIRALLHYHPDVLVRMPLLPGINDDKDNLEAMGTFLETCRKGVRMELLPFHRLGESKYRRMKKVYAADHVLPPSEEAMNRAKNILRSFDIHVAD
jgi:pyruvate formate lyase activating enzyme